MNVFITNLGMYNEGSLHGKWIEIDGTLEYEDLKEGGKYDIGLNERYEEFFITDYEAPVRIEEYTSISRLNEMYEMITEIKENIGFDDDDIEAILSYIDLEELHEHYEELHVYHDCNDMTDVAYEYAEGTGLLDSMPENLRNYFDFEAFGRDMGFEGTYIFSKSGICIQLAY